MEYKELNYCSKCIMPETVEGANFDENGECITCQAQKQKKEINWDEREKALQYILKNAKENSGDNYDCIIPISGGKDSAWQCWNIVKKYGLKPLAITFNHGGFTKTGWYNLWNLLNELSMDHIQFTLNYNLVKKVARRSIETIGDYCYHCHALVNAFTLKMAATYGIKLISWGESAAEYGHQRITYNNPLEFDENYFTKLSSKLTPEQFACDDISLKDLFPFQIPTKDELNGIKGIHLGDYIEWKTEEQVKFVKKVLNWQGREISGSYKDYKSAECSFEPMHEFLCLLKRGFARTSIQASQEVREGKLTKEDAFYLIKVYERIEPKHLQYFLEFAGIGAGEFREMIEKLKHEKFKDVKIELDKEWRSVEEDGIPFVLRFIDEMKNK
jgi:N-acetyl sugar amidotransferase